MKRKTRNCWKRIVSLALAAFLLCLPVTDVRAASDGGYEEETDQDVVKLESTVYTLSEEELADRPTPYTMLVDCSIAMCCETEGLVVDISTGSSQTASYLGIKDIKVQKKTWYGSWKTVAIVEDVEASNCAIMGVSFIYTGAEVGSTYRVHCVHYGKVDSDTEAENTTGGVIFRP